MASAPTELFRARDGSLSDASESKAPPSVSALTDVGTGSGIGTDGDDQAVDSSVWCQFRSPPSPGLACDAASREADSSATHLSSCPHTQALYQCDGTVNSKSPASALPVAARPVGAVPGAVVGGAFGDFGPSAVFGFSACEPSTPPAPAAVVRPQTRPIHDASSGLYFCSVPGCRYAADIRSAVLLVGSTIILCTACLLCTAARSRFRSPHNFNRHVSCKHTGDSSARTCSWGH
jgi:hypothetical protein